MTTKKKVEASALIGAVIKEIIVDSFKEAAGLGSLSETFQDLQKHVSLHLYQKVTPFIVQGIKEGMTCCEQEPEVRITLDSIFIRCGGCAARTLITSGGRQDESIDECIHVGEH